MNVIASIVLNTWLHFAYIVCLFIYQRTRWIEPLRLRNARRGYFTNTQHLSSRTHCRGRFIVSASSERTIY